MMEFKNTLYEKAEGIATITINRPEVRNALNNETIAELHARLDDAEKDDSVRVIVLTGAGDRAFCSGLDLNIVKDVSPMGGAELSRTGQALCTRVESLGKPVIAAINGYAFGGGTELALASDIRIASETATVGLTELNVGLIPGWGGTQRLPRYVGKGKAKEMIFASRRVDAKTAEQLGLVNMVVPADQLMAKTKEFALEVAGKSPIALRLSKMLINNSTEVNPEIGFQQEAEAFGLVASTEDFKEGVTAFLEKRKPIYKGR
jgi:enoyl-CoA hydratase/carnithine racemase